MKRNEKATCATCPYHSSEGFCKRMPQRIAAQSDDWCGEHPDFPDFPAKDHLLDRSTEALERIVGALREIDTTLSRLAT